MSKKYDLYRIADRMVRTITPFTVVDSHEDFVESSKDLYEESLETGKLNSELFHDENRDLKD